jgi:exopolysaccharide biosynthesis polyprenyl glycosylphosphotransferase
LDAYPKRSARKVLLVLDALVVLLSMGLAYSVHAWLHATTPLLKDLPPFSQYATLAYLTLPLFLTLVSLLGLHRLLERPLGPLGLFRELVRLHVLGMLGLAVIIVAAQAVINRSLIVVFLGSTFLLLWLEKSAILSWLRYQHRRGHGRQRLLLVGEPDAAMAGFAETASAHPLPPHIVGYLEPGTGAERGVLDRLPPCLGALDRIEAVLQEEAVDRVLFLPPLTDPMRAEGPLSVCVTLGVPADFAVDLGPSPAAPPRVHTLYDRLFISVDPASRSVEAVAIKHALDLAIALVSLVLTAPILLLTALVIRIAMGRPIFFVQKRAGLYGRLFGIIKFRTMEVDAETRRADVLSENALSGPVFKHARDPRVTPLGHLLRRASLDELPQLINVLRGDMSLVGPRPLPVQEQQELTGWRRRRLTMKPGITGLWQVSGRSSIDLDAWMDLDLKYVDSWSLLLDLKILLRTIPAVLFRRGAR